MNVCMQTHLRRLYYVIIFQRFRSVATFAITFNETVLRVIEIKYIDTLTHLKIRPGVPNLFYTADF